jgi:hypothetical protein
VKISLRAHLLAAVALFILYLGQEYCAPARLADLTSWISCFATTRWSVVTLDPEKKADEQPLLLLVDTTIEGESLSHARQE